MRKDTLRDHKTIGFCFEGCTPSFGRILIIQLRKLCFCIKSEIYRVVDMARDMFVVVEEFAPLQVMDMRYSFWVIFGLMAFSIHFTV